MTSNVSGRVAALTEKFNKIIEKDVNFLNEVKRNNGVLLSRAGHVYKIVEDKKQTTSTALVVTPPSPPQPPLQPPPQAPEQAMENNASPKHATVNNSVKETIKIFENLKAPTKVPPNRSTFKLDLILNSQELEKIDEVLTPVKDEGSLIAEDMHFDDETDKKILEAIDLVENKIAFLSKEHYDEEFKREEAEEVAVAKEVVEPVYAPLNPKPNESFLHSTKITSIPIIEAVNSSLIARKHIYDDENASNNGYSPIIYKEICNTYEYIKTAPTATDNDDAPETAEIIASACKDDIYEVCESKEKISQRTTTDELPPLPEPKRKTAPQEVARELPKIPSNCGAVDDLYDLGGEIEMEENIYATIRGYDGDNMSVISHNGYESIGGYQKIKKSPSISTISSDLKANSLYGVSMVPMVDGGESRTVLVKLCQ
uniref:Uncharacterized protein n=1 Tax=Megaselia scalaris TaxID=36166 RepID=T1GQW0_MEGSC